MKALEWKPDSSLAHRIGHAGKHVQNSFDVSLADRKAVLQAALDPASSTACGSTLKQLPVQFIEDRLLQIPTAQLCPLIRRSSTSVQDR
jgi:hypothetical protein